MADAFGFRVQGLGFREHPEDLADGGAEGDDIKTKACAFFGFPETPNGSYLIWGVLIIRILLFRVLS